MTKTALVTGTSTGIGLSLAKELIEKGYEVIGTSRNGSVANFSHEQLTMLALDVSDAESLKTAQDQIREMIPSLDLFVNNAGIGPDLGKATPDVESFVQTFAVNTQGPVFFSEPLLDLIKPNGLLINISSKMGSLSDTNRHSSTAYCMSKAALNMYTKHLANRLDGKVRVACLHPGWVATAINGYTSNAPLTASESAEKIMRFIDSEFKQGVFWDVQDWVELEW